MIKKFDTAALGLELTSQCGLIDFDFAAEANQDFNFFVALVCKARNLLVADNSDNSLAHFYFKLS